MTAAELKAQIEKMIQERIEVHFERMTSSKVQNKISEEGAWLALRDLMSKISSIKIEDQKP